MINIVLTETKARKFAKDWIEAWNSHDVDAIMDHYAPQVKLTSPVAARLLDDAAGSVVGSEALRKYFQKGLEVYPELSFELLDVMWGISSVILYYRNHVGTKSGEFMEFDSEGKVVRVVANYNG
ncbi:MAG TPA: nuclear transport factor 2 family protein [Terriglobales bacterium]|nr:nuclear transport factor 2 family protein [Terriglobales bacterium]